MKARVRRHHCALPESYPTINQRPFCYHHLRFLPPRHRLMNILFPYSNKLISRIDSLLVFQDGWSHRHRGDWISYPLRDHFAMHIIVGSELCSGIHRKQSTISFIKMGPNRRRMISPGLGRSSQKRSRTQSLSVMRTQKQQRHSSTTFRLGGRIDDRSASLLAHGTCRNLMS